ncbi:MAG: YybH family protein [Planctomycetota bacterium]
MNDDHAVFSQLEHQLSLAIRERNLGKVMNFYSADARLLPPNGPELIGFESVQAAWKALLAIPQFSVTLECKHVGVAADRSIAYDVGTYQQSYQKAGGLFEDHGKYLVVWRREAAHWKIVADMFNSSVSAPA